MNEKLKPSAVLIVGQGLAGTVLAWTLERAGIAWSIIDAGPEVAASRVAAGIVNPVTGQRWVKSWRVDELMPSARAVYREMEADFGVPLWRDLVVRRRWRDARESEKVRAKLAAGELAPYVTAMDDAGCTIAPAGRLDLPALLNAASSRWQREGKLAVGRMDWTRLGDDHELVIDCTGAAARHGRFAAMDFSVSKGETLQVRLPHCDMGVIINRGHWLLPVSEREAWVGATHEPGVENVEPSAAAREQLLASACDLAGGPVEPLAQTAGLRLMMRARHPLAGRHPQHPRLGICGALGSKGVLYAPWLARQWAAHLQSGAPFDPAVGFGRWSGVQPIDITAPN